MRSGYLSAKMRGLRLAKFDRPMAESSAGTKSEGPPDINLDSMSKPAVVKITRMICVDPMLLYSKVDLTECSVDEATLKTISTEILENFAYARHLYLDSNDIGLHGLTQCAMDKIAGKVTHLTMVDNCLGDHAAFVIAQALRNDDCQIEYLDISNNNIQSPGGIAIMEALASNHSVEWLSVQYNMIGTSAIRALGNSLKSNSTLKTIFLGHNYVTEEAVEPLMTGLMLNTTLEEIHLQNNFLSPRSKCSLRRAYSNIELRQEIKPVTALLYGSISRLGKTSPVIRLPSDVLAVISEMVVDPAVYRDRGCPRFSFISVNNNWTDDDDDGDDEVLDHGW